MSCLKIAKKNSWLVYIGMNVFSYQRTNILRVLVYFVFFISLGASGDSDEGFVEVHPSGEEIIEELTVRKTFPQYRIHFNPKRIQGEVYKEFLKEKETDNQKNPSGS